jgi:hypothetical protein
MSNPFEKPSIPKNSLQLLQWLLFEPVLLRRYEESLNKIQTVIVILKGMTIGFPIIILLTLVIYFISVIIIAGFDLPLLLPPDASKIDRNELFVQ